MAMSRRYRSQNQKRSHKLARKKYRSKKRTCIRLRSPVSRKVVSIQRRKPRRAKTLAKLALKRYFIYHDNSYVGTLF